ncbi:MAG: hypothetical protein LBI64_02400, partial [Coriobacteriales bacterium]|nr:hypothetical protein [Coriobacteriales bacterium]
MIATEPLVTSSARPKLIPSDWDLLLTEIVAHPEVPCFIVAPAGFGKTSLLTALTQRYGASGKTSWIGGTRTELLAELSGEQDARDRLIIIDDFSFLDSEQAEAFSNELDTLIERGARLVVSCTPEHDCFGALQSDRLLIDSMRLCAATRTPTAPTFPTATRTPTAPTFPTATQAPTFPTATRTPTAPTAPTSPAATQAPTSPASPTSPVSPAHTSAHTSTHTSEHTSPYEPDTLQELAVDPAAPATSADEGIPVLDLRFFGDLVIWRKGRRIEAELMRRGKVRSLFILLALNLGRSVARETILERLWP